MMMTMTTAINNQDQGAYPSKADGEGINSDPKTYEWCICSNPDPVACTYFSASLVDYYTTQFEPCKCACHLNQEKYYANFKF
jgi:hypothetical protein